MGNAIVRQATCEDIPQMFRVRHAVRENRLFAGVAIEPEEVQKAIEETGRGWVVDVGGKIAGFAIGNADTGNIWALFVDPAVEGLGYGQRLHAEMVSWLWSKGLRRLWLNTDPNTRAQRFYERRGWIAMGVNEEGEVRYELERSERGADSE